MPPITIVLVPSPLLGPICWHGVQAHLRSAGFLVTILDPRPVIAAGPPFHQRLAEAIAEAAGEPEYAVLVGHSAAGPLLPGAATSVRAPRCTTVFVDARLPHPGATWLDSLTPERRASLIAAAVDGYLPAWDTWFPPGALTELVPDPELRQNFVVQQSRLPMAYLEETAPEPGAGWDRAAKAYLELSAAYRNSADQATERGWRVACRDADHLALLTSPQMVAAAVLALTELDVN